MLSCMTFVFCSLLELAWVGYLSREELNVPKPVVAKLSPTGQQDDDSSIKLVQQDRYETNSLLPRSECLYYYISK